jgi:hypothetical protein
MNTQLKLDLVTAGYSPDKVGLFTMFLNTKYKISEDKVREILWIASAPIEETIQSLDELGAQERAVAKSAIDHLEFVMTHGGGSMPRQAPDPRLIGRAIQASARASRLQIHPQRVNDLIEWFTQNWQSVLDMETPQETNTGNVDANDLQYGERGEQDPDGPMGQSRLSQVPQIPKRSPPQQTTQV